MDTDTLLPSGILCVGGIVGARSASENLKERENMKVEINVRHGGFGLSHEGILRYLELAGKPVWVEEDEDWKGRFNYWLVPKEERVINAESEFWSMNHEEKMAYNKAWSEQNFHCRDISRTDPILIQVVEELNEVADGDHACLKVVEIPDDVEWQIDEYDGAEWVAEKHRTWC